MKTILILLLFISNYCFAQGQIGVSKKDLVNHFGKLKDFKYELKGDTLKYMDQGVSFALYFKNDTVLYYKTLTDNSFLNKTKQAYDDDTKGLYFVQDWAWINHVPHRGSFLYTIEFPEKINKFITTVQRIK
jgi:hypothetical protein